jgi:N-acetylneuraminate lyase
VKLSDANRLTGLVAATHTPFHADSSLNLDIVEKLAAHLLANGVQIAFIGGTTGESHSLSLEERRLLAQRWCEIARGSKLRVVVHVGSNCLADAAALAAQAQELGAAAISALAPSYFKPNSVTVLVDCCAQIAAAAPETPFYFYDIPSLTGVNLPMPEFLTEARPRIPNLAGLKLTNPDLMAYQLCLNADGGAFDCPWGTDEALLAALAVGARGAVGSTYNFAAPIYHRLIAAFANGDLAAAREEQIRGMRLVRLLGRYDFMGAAKALMRMLGVDVGPPRLPNASLSPRRMGQLEQELREMGFFDWIRAADFSVK